MESYHDRTWLQDQYIVQGKTITQIAEEVSCSTRTIHKHLKRFGIPTRVRGKRGNHIEITEALLEYLDGTLLGDGHLSGYWAVSSSYNLTQRHLSYIHYVRNKLIHLDLDSGGNIWTRLHLCRNGEYTVSHSFATRAYRELREQRDRWYPNGKKRVPKDVRLTPLSVRTWFLEDGSLERRTSYTYGNRIKLYTCAFTRNLHILVDGLKDILDTDAIHVHASDNTIAFGRCEVVKRFFDFILPLPKELELDYGYKYLS